MIKLPKTSEELTPQMLDNLEEILVDTCHKFEIDYKQLLIMGSYIFGVPDPGDIDILISADKCSYAADAETLNTTRPEGIREVQDYLNTQIKNPVEIKIQKNWSPAECDLGYIIPYYDILTRSYEHKKPGSCHPFHYRWSIPEGGFVCYMRDKRTRALSLLF